MWDNPQHCFRLRFGFKSRNQLQLFMVWREEWFCGEVIYARVLFNSMRWISIPLRRTFGMTRSLEEADMGSLQQKCFMAFAIGSLALACVLLIMALTA
jgi:hypothetical protein